MQKRCDIVGGRTRRLYVCLLPDEGEEIYKPAKLRRCGTKEQVLLCIPWCAGGCTISHPRAFWSGHLPPVTPRCPPHLSVSPPFTPTSGGRSCSIPAGPGLFISSEVAMINEALNTSSVSLGPGEPPQLSKQAPAAALQSRHRSWSTREPIRKTGRREFEV